MSERCGYRTDSCSDTGTTIKGVWTCSTHQYANEFQSLRDERDRLRSALRAALDDVPGWVELACAALTPAGGAGNVA